MIRALLASSMALVLGLLLPHRAFAGPADDAAVEAAEVSAEHCQKITSRKPEEVVRANKAVADALEKLQAAFESTGDASLRYWRGMLVQCLDRPETAVADFEAFIAAQSDKPMYAGMVKEAKARLNRLRGKKRGEGPAAEWLRRAGRVEASLALAGGFAPRFMGCRDQPSGAQGGRAINAACLGGVNPRLVWGFSVTPEVAGALDVFVGTRGGGGSAARTGKAATVADLGLGVRAALGVQSPAATLEPAFSGLPAGFVAGGPRLRVLQAGNAGVAALAVRLGGEFVADLSPTIPWAGSSKYNDLGLLDPGTWAMTGFGGSGWFRASVELSPKVVVEVGGEGGFVASSAALIRNTRPGVPTWVAVVGSTIPDAETIHGCPEEVPHDERQCEEVQGMPPVLSGHRWWADFHLGVFGPTKHADAAIGGELTAGFHDRLVRLADEDAYDWCVPGSDCALDPDSRRVFSTEWGDVRIRVALVLRFASPPF